LDGDIGMIVPTKEDGDLSILNDILNIHKQNVDVAVANWNSFVQNMLNIIEYNLYNIFFNSLQIII
jgi:hypothetical protein